MSSFSAFLVLIVLAGFVIVTGQPGFPQNPPSFGGPPNTGFPRFPSPGPPSGGGAPGAPGALGAPGAFGSAGGGVNPYTPLGNNIGTNIGGFGSNLNPWAGLGGAGFAAAPQSQLGFNNFGGNPTINAQARPNFGGFQTPTVGGFGTPTANPLNSLLGGQTLGAGMTVDQMRTLDNALFGGGANIFQTEQPSTVFNYPMQAHSMPAEQTNTFTTQQFGPGPGPTVDPFGPMGPAAGLNSPAATSLLNRAFANPTYQQQQNPAYNSLNSGFNNFLQGVGSGLTNAGRDIAAGYAPPTLTQNPIQDYTMQNPAVATQRASTPIPRNSAGSPSTLTATYPGVGTVDLGVPITGSRQVTEAQVRLPPASPIQSASSERMTISKVH